MHNAGYLPSIASFVQIFDADLAQRFRNADTALPADSGSHEACVREPAHDTGDILRRQVLSPRNLPVRNVAPIAMAPEVYESEHRGIQLLLC
jgi:hypothetical protein